ncbi:hypothetical protein TSUD_229800 [Trifolium subterraneum]|uniref:Reverse transcriptase zinc-binding domain-containing protein n=1 Tax=Trifolium subterraneum TaxID=3900 RepID=A0A2Z6LKA2_TRISU|nr:hypothetical protein TSUD_229800 [Trifolium subterraneum]
MLLKVDFERAYDTVNWRFLERMMIKMGFAEGWLKWMRACIFESSMSILVNGSPTDDFKVFRGLRQGTWDNLWTIKSVLRGFELVSGLKINFMKSKLYGINVDDRFLEAGSSFLSCRSDVIPFKFLGIPTGANPRRKETWKPVVDAMTKRLSSWRSRQLSYGALLSKWKWRFLNDGEAVWADLIQFRYGHLPTKLLSGEVASIGIKDSIWWRDVISVGHSADENWFRSNVSAVVGDGTNIGFWKFKWFGNSSFRDLFPDLYAKEAFQDAFISERLNCGGVSPYWTWYWREQLSAVEEHQLADLKELLTSFSLVTNNPDKWHWKLSSMGIFTVKSCYNSLSQYSNDVVINQNVMAAAKKMWRNDVPFKVNVFGWRLFLEKLPTKAALNHRGVWDDIFKWLGIGLSTGLDCCNHFLSFVWDHSSLVDDILATSWVWFSSRSGRKSFFSFSDW